MSRRSGKLLGDDSGDSEDETDGDCFLDTQSSVKLTSGECSEHHHDRSTRGPQGLPKGADDVDAGLFVKVAEVALERGNTNQRSGEKSVEAEAGTMC